MKTHGGDTAWAVGNSRQMHGGQNRTLQESLMNSAKAKETSVSFPAWHRSGKPLCPVHTFPHLTDPAPRVAGAQLSPSTL